MNVDLSRNPKQELFFNIAMSAAFGKNEYRNLFYGGGIRGGKSFVCLATLAILAKMFEGSRWHIFRADFPALQATTIPSFEKVIKGSKNWGWSKDKSNYFAYHRRSDSKIFFKGENRTHDPNLNDLLGLETNGILYEQIEELSEKLWNIGLSRNGSWYIPNMPTPITMATFNPTQTWVKNKIYEPYVKGELIAPNYLMLALHSDNFFVTAEQRAAWNNMADPYRLQFIDGDWTDFGGQNNKWAFAYSPAKHKGFPELRTDQTIYLSFDFNVNPMCCSVIQWYDGRIRVLETIKLPNSGTEAICEHILVKYGGKGFFYVTGDATGTARRAEQVDNMHNYHIIKNKLNLSMQQLKVPASNPTLASNKVLVNSILQNYNVEIHEEKAAALHFDLGNVKIHPDGRIIKEDRNDPTQQADALDTFRYWCNTFMPDFVNWL